MPDIAITYYVPRKGDLSFSHCFGGFFWSHTFIKELRDFIDGLIIASFHHLKSMSYFKYKPSPLISLPYPLTTNIFEFATGVNESRGDWEPNFLLV